MRILPRRAEPPEAGWFQIGDMPESAAPRRRGSGRVSLSVVQDEPKAATDTSRLVPIVEAADAIAEKVLARIAELRYGALAVCGGALGLLLLVIVMVASHGGGSSSASSGAAAPHREQAQIAHLKSKLRSSRRQLAAAGAALTPA